MITCPKCNKPTLDSNAVCPYCGTVLNKAAAESQKTFTPNPNAPSTRSFTSSTSSYYTRTSENRPFNYPIGGLVAWSVVTTLCCCLIPGIMALAYACDINSSSTVSEQRHYIHACKVWCTVGMILGVIIIIIAAISRS